MKKIIESLSQKLKLDKKLVAIILVGAVGISLLVLSELISLPEKDESDEETEPQSFEDYAEDTEKRLESLISSIQGAGKTKVMVTLDCSDENVYATEEKDTDTAYERNVVIIETENGEGGMLVKITEPKIRGVAVVCAGGSSPAVKQSIIEAVTAVLDISSARVSISTMKTDNGG